MSLVHMPSKSLPCRFWLEIFSAYRLWKYSTFQRVPSWYLALKSLQPHLFTSHPVHPNQDHPVTVHRARQNFLLPTILGNQGHACLQFFFPFFLYSILFSFFYFSFPFFFFFIFFFFFFFYSSKTARGLRTRESRGSAFLTFSSFSLFLLFFFLFFSFFFFCSFSFLLFFFLFLFHFFFLFLFLFLLCFFFSTKTERGLGAHQWRVRPF